MDNDSGWAAKEITLVTHETEKQDERLTLACRWVELVQAWDGAANSYFLISGVENSDIPERPWLFVSFKDVRGKTHHYPIHGALPQGPHALRLPRKPHHPG